MPSSITFDHPARSPSHGSDDHLPTAHIVCALCSLSSPDHRHHLSTHACLAVHDRPSSSLPVPTVQTWPCTPPPPTPHATPFSHLYFVRRAPSRHEQLSTIPLPLSPVLPPSPPPSCPSACMSSCSCLDLGRSTTGRLLRAPRPGSVPLARRRLMTPASPTTSRPFPFSALLLRSSTRSSMTDASSEWSPSSWRSKQVAQVRPAACRTPSWAAPSLRSSSWADDPAALPSSLQDVTYPDEAHLETCVSSFPFL